MITKSGDLLVMALYTSQVWEWGGLSRAHLFGDQMLTPFDTTNDVLAPFNEEFAPLRHSLLHRHLRFVSDPTPAKETAPASVPAWWTRRRRGSTGARSFERDAGTRDDIMTGLHEASFEDIEAVVPSDIAHA